MGEKSDSKINIKTNMCIYTQRQIQVEYFYIYLYFAYEEYIERTGLVESGARTGGQCFETMQVRLSERKLWHF